MEIGVAAGITIALITLGPFKLLAPFSHVTEGFTDKERRSLALRSTLIALLIVLLIAAFGTRTLGSWGVPPGALEVAGGLLLLVASLRILRVKTMFELGNAETIERIDEVSHKAAISPIAVPMIVPPIGVVGVLMMMTGAQGDAAAQWTVVAILVGIMFVNFLSMTLVDEIVGVVGLAPIVLIFWVLAVMQAALAVTLMTQGLFELGFPGG